MDEITLDEHFIKKDKNIRPNKERAKIAQILIWVVMIVDIIAIVSSYLQYNLLVALQNFEEISDETIASNDEREQLIGFLSLAILLISSITFIQWFRRAYYNLNIRTICSYTDGWAAGAWFIPIILLFRPYQIMKEMWIKTSRLIELNTEKNEGSNSSIIVGVWWTLWIISSFVGNYVMRISFKAETIENYINSTIGDIAMSITGIPLAIVAVLMIKKYSKKEEKLSRIEMNENWV
jgi:hypothetical protein